MKIQTIAGEFDRQRLDSLRQTLLNAYREDQSVLDVIEWEGQPLMIAFGWYLVAYIEMMFQRYN